MNESNKNDRLNNLEQQKNEVGYKIEESSWFSYDKLKYIALVLFIVAIGNTIFLNSVDNGDFIIVDDTQIKVTDPVVVNESEGVLESNPFPLITKNAGWDLCPDVGSCFEKVIIMNNADMVVVDSFGTSTYALSDDDLQSIIKVQQELKESPCEYLPVEDYWTVYEIAGRDESIEFPGCYRELILIDQVIERTKTVLYTSETIKFGRAISKSDVTDLPDSILTHGEVLLIPEYRFVDLVTIANFEQKDIDILQYSLYYKSFQIEKTNLSELSGSALTIGKDGRFPLTVKENSYLICLANIFPGHSVGAPYSVVGCDFVDLSDLAENLSLTVSFGEGGVEAVLN